ncbi:MAG: hypothetical protein GY940_46405, partial [bacterium]|nr:hypothetical protein [bacterium]
IPIIGRNKEELQDIIGIFLNTLALRNTPSNEKTFAQFLGEVKNHTLRAYENQDYPFEKLVDKLNAGGDTGRNPLFDIMFAYNNTGIPVQDKAGTTIPGLKLKPCEGFERQSSPFDIYIAGNHGPECLSFTMGYSTKLFKEETIQRMIGYFKEIVTVISNDKTVRLEDIDISHDLVEPRTTEFQLNFGF